MQGGSRQKFLTRAGLAPENEGENHDISFEAPFTLSVADTLWSVHV